jgi:hypothetical protein
MSLNQAPMPFVGAIVLAVAVAAGALLERGAPWPGGARTASAQPGECVDLLNTFDSYPLVYLGDEFEGHDLRRCVRKQTSEVRGADGAVRKPAMDFVIFAYGACDPFPAGCSPPVQVISDPSCGPKIVEGGATARQVVRGEDIAVLQDGSARVEAPGFSASVYAGDSDMAVRAVAALRGANPIAASLAQGSDLARADLPRGTLCP